MNFPETRADISPTEMHRRIASEYEELPAKASPAKAFTIAVAVAGGYVLVLLPISSELGDLGSTLNVFGFFIGAMSIYAVFSNYFTDINNRQAEINRRQKIKEKYDRMNNWYSGDEQLHRNSTKSETGRATYPVDWSNRKEYVRTRDGACFLCKGGRDNDRYYFYRPRDGRHLNKSGKDFALYNQVHHIVPISKGGTHEVSNLVYLCNLCHEDQHGHLLKRRVLTLERKSKQSRDSTLKAFWSLRLNDVQRRLVSLERHRNSPESLRLHRLADVII